MSTATDMLALYIAAETAVLAGKSYSIGDKSYSYENLNEIRAGRAEWQQKVNEETATATKSGSGFCAFADFTD